MDYLKLYENFSDTKYKVGDYVLVSTKIGILHPNRFAKILFAGRFHNGYVDVEEYRLGARLEDGTYTNELRVAVSEIERKLTDKEIEECNIKFYSKKYNL